MQYLCQPLVVENGTDLQLSEWQYVPKSNQAKAESKEENTSKLSATVSEGLVLINSDNQKTIVAADTTTFSQKMLVYIQNKIEEELMVYEPLGDGFYFSPLTISKSGKQIRINSERNHLWKIHIAAPDKPQKVIGADSWIYDQENKQVVAQKEGMQFEISVE